MKILLVMMIFGMVALAGCGQKGPLYFPQPETGAEQTKPDSETDENASS